MQPPEGLLHHSDRGSQYASDAYREILQQNGVVASMSSKGNCYDNAMMERLPAAVSRTRLWATLKTGLVDGRVFASHAEARSEIFRYIEVFYNRQRLHSALGDNSPVDFENQLN